MALRRERAALAHMPRPHAIARVRENTHAYPLTCPDSASIDIYMHMTSALAYIYRRTYTDAGVMATAASSVRADTRTCASQAVHSHMHAHTHLPQKTYIPIHIRIMHTYIYIYIYTYIKNPTFLLAAIPTHVGVHTRTHVGTRACACPHVCAHTQENASAAPPRRPGRKGGAYKGQRGDRRGVPRADVRVERRRNVERLRAEPRAVEADGTRAHVSVRMCGRQIARARTIYILYIYIIYIYIYLCRLHTYICMYIHVCVCIHTCI